MIRKAVRGLVLTPDGQFLMMRIQLPDVEKYLWILPGGGLNLGETPEETLQRELYEETGLKDAIVLSKLWDRFHRFQWGEEWLSQAEEFYLVKAEKYEPNPHFLEEGAELDSFRGLRWWTVEEVLNSNENFVPGKLGEVVQELLINGVPAEPFDVGV